MLRLLTTPDRRRQQHADCGGPQAGSVEPTNHAGAAGRTSSPAQVLPCVKRERLHWSGRHSNSPKALRTCPLDRFLDKVFDTAPEAGAGVELIIQKYQRPILVILCGEKEAYHSLRR